MRSKIRDTYIQNYCPNKRPCPNNPLISCSPYRGGHYVRVCVQLDHASFLKIQILSVDPEQGRVQVKVRLVPEPDMARVVGSSHRYTVRYLPSYMVAQQLGLKSLVLSRISGSIQVEKGTPKK